MFKLIVRLAACFGWIALLGGVAVAKPSEVTLYDGGVVASVVYDTASGTPVRKAAELLSHDLSQLTGHAPFVAPDLKVAKGAGVIVGLASSPSIAALLKKNKISTAAIDGKWETYGRAVIPAPWDPTAKAILIFGSDARGAVWGVVDLTREMGVSAWEWWADVKIRKVDHIAIPAELRYSKEPSVKYRGFFINASNLRVWAAKTYDKSEGGIGPKTYERVFELMWRLKSNMLWPGMNGSDPPFNVHKENYDLAKDYAIVRGTSHVEMLLRNNAAEWDPKTMGPYNWVKNKNHLKNYWHGAVEKWGAYDNLYTIGMRGADDFPMEGADTAEKMGDILHDVVSEQRKILSETLKKPADQIPQVFTPYKEITAAYNTGRINLPKDVTIVWPDDNYGYLLQLSDAKERQNPGGSGVYYHATFWGAPGNYLFLASTDPSLMWEEMSRSYHFDARNIWMLNVGNIKPCEYLTDFFLAMAFDMDAFAKPGSARAYLQNWSAQNFGKAHGDEIADVMWRYYKLAFNRNPEFMAFSTTFPETAVQQTRYNITDFGDENARRADAYKTIMAESKSLMASMPEDRKSAFYELVDYTVNTGGNMSLKQLAMDKSIAYGLQRRASANVYAEEVEKAHQQIAENVRRYNQDNADGKWNGIATDYPQTLPNYLPMAIPSWKMPTDWSRCGVQVDGGGYFDDKGWWYPTLPTFNRELGNRSYYMDIFTEQPVSADWSVTPNAPWIRTDKRAGHFSPATKQFEQRLHVSVDWSKAPQGQSEGLINVSCSAGQKPIEVHVRLAPPLADKAASFIDAQGVVSMYAAHADALTGAWRVLDGVGHTGADVQASLDMAPVDPDDAAALAKAPRLLYRFATLPPDHDYSFPNYVTDETATVKAIGLPVFPTTKNGRLRIAVSLDRGRPQVLDFNVVYYGAKWRQNVLDNAAAVELRDVPLKPGSHTLEVYALDPGVTLDRFEIRFAGAAQAYDAAPETQVAH
ncbi:glycosyl hydrolase 115 family protein [Caulobacter sp. S45]|uniref:glycosyl hydrolase 115 family protein n=1 Tax=Caulobacter sp. S45 TaxID=1641861 RepID=UPI00131D78F7|nr:glycosyl hydrolase 115 family protein [Caulobacter sp. S45]